MPTIDLSRGVISFEQDIRGVRNQPVSRGKLMVMPLDQARRQRTEAEESEKRTDVRVDGDSGV